MTVFIAENYDEEIENILVAESGDFEQKICYKLTEACKGVDRSKTEKEEMEVNINDKKQNIPSININEEGAVEKVVNQINMAANNKNDL